MAAQAAAPWVDRDSSGHDGLDDVLLDQLAAELGGNPMPINFAAKSPGLAGNHQFNAPLSQTGSLPLSAAAQLGGISVGLLQQGSLPQPMVLPFGLHCDPQQLHNGTLPTSFGSAPDPQQPNSLNSVNSLSFAPGSLMQQQGHPFLMFRTAFGANGVLPAAAAAAAGTPDMRPAASKSQSPSTSSGCQPGGDDSLDLSDMHRTHKTLNKGALAQKRFRERQKEKMRANEAQVAELTHKLGQLEMEKSRLESRARLLEQVVSLNLIHEAKLHTNREIMVREQEMLLEDLAAFILQLSPATLNTGGAGGGGNTPGSSPNGPEWLHGALAGAAGMMAQQQQQLDSQVLQQQDVLHPLQQQQSGSFGVGGSSSSPPYNVQVHSLTQVIRGWTVQNMMDQVLPQYIRCLQRLLPFLSNSPCNGSSGSNVAATAAAQQVEALVLKRREMTDRHALFSHYYWAVWCFNMGDMGAQQLMPPTPADWARVLAHLNLSKEQTDAIVAARTSLLRELQRVASDWQRVLPTLALQLLQVPRAQWHTVGAVQAMVTNLAAEREAVVGFLHTIIDEVLTPVQEGQLEASSYPWCPDVWTIAGAAAAATATAAAAAQAGQPDSSLRNKAGRKNSQAAQDLQQAAAAAAAQLIGDEDPLTALAVGTDVLQPLMPFMTAFQLLREPVTAKGAGLRLKRALLLDPFRTVVPAAAYPRPSTSEVAAMSLLDAHCGTFQKVMLWDWLKTNLPSYVTILGMHTHLPIFAGPSSSAAAAPAPTPLSLGLTAGGSFTAAHGLPAAPTAVLQHSMSTGNLTGPGMFMV